MSKKPSTFQTAPQTTPMSKENLASNIIGFPIIKSPLRTVWTAKPSKTNPKDKGSKK